MKSDYPHLESLFRCSVLLGSFWQRGSECSGGRLFGYSWHRGSDCGGGLFGYFRQCDTRFTGLKSGGPDGDEGLWILDFSAF